MNEVRQMTVWQLTACVRGGLAAVLLLVWPIGSASAADAARPLAALIPADAGVCIEARDLAAHVQTFRQGNLFERLKSYPPLARWATKQTADFQKIDAYLRAQLDAGLEETFAGVLGGEAAIAVWPADDMPAGEKPIDVPMLLVLRAPDAALLGKLQSHLVSAAKNGGDWRGERQLEIGGMRFTAQLVDAKPARRTSYFLVHENLGIVTNREALLRQALERHTSVAEEECLARQPAYQAAIARLAPAASVRLFLNPRVWDKSISAGSAQDPNRDPLKHVVIRTWEASQYVAASLSLGRDVEAELYLQCDGAALPEPLRSAVGSLSGSAAALEHLPGDAVAAVAGRLDVRKIVRALFLPGPNGRSAVPAPQSDFGWALGMSIASGLGPNLGACLIPASPAEKTAGASWPVVWVAGLETQPLESDREQPSLGQSLEPVLRTALAIAAAANKAKHPETTAVIETFKVGDLSLTRIDGMRLFGAQRAFLYTLVQNHLLAGGSPEAVTRVAQLSAGDSLAHNPRLKKLLSPRIGTPSQLLYLDLAGLRRLLTSSPQTVEALATAKGLDQATAARSWQELVSLFNLADTVVAEAKIDASGLAISARAVADDAP